MHTAESRHAATCFFTSSTGTSNSNLQGELQVTTAKITASTDWAKIPDRYPNHFAPMQTR